MITHKLTDKQIKQVILKLYKTHGNVRVSLGLLITLTLQHFEFPTAKYQTYFDKVDKYVRSHCGKNDLFSAKPKMIGIKLTSQGAAKAYKQKSFIYA